MTPLQAIALGTLQALTEFLPISSSGHLIILPSVLGWSVQPLVFDTVLHLGTALALLVYFWKDLISILKGFFDSAKTQGTKFANYSLNGKLGLFIVLGSIPAVILGFFLESRIETTFRDISYVIIFLAVGTVFMFLAEKFFSKGGDVEKLDWKKSLVIGVFQSLALFPGVSRSGSTISGGMYMGLSRVAAARFSFLLSIPVIVGAGLFKVIDSYKVIDQTSSFILLLGFFTSFIVGILVIKFLLKFLQNYSLYWFVAYRIILIGFLVYFLI